MLITSRANPRFKQLRALARNGGKTGSAGRTLLEGMHLVREYATRIGPPECLIVNAQVRQPDELAALLQQHPATEILTLDNALFAQIGQLKSPADVLAQIVIPPPMQTLMPGDAVYLSHIQDAGNVGMIMRTAAAAGIRQLLIGPGCAAAWSPRVLRAAQGAHFALHLLSAHDLPGILSAFPGRRLAAVAQAGENLYTQDLRDDIMWIFGNEGSGPTEEALAAADTRITIPLYQYESLNVAAAAAICLFEARRQKFGIN